MKPLELGSPSDIQVGADVFAIGHPTGEAWTYTRGLISQIRNDYAWKDEMGEHHANVIQTQTPISPGSSGGPLLGESGKILGVNTFKATDGENLNFAVSVRDVEAFVRLPAVASPQNPDRPPMGSVGRTKATPPSGTTKKCTPRIIYEGRNKTNDGGLVIIDYNCDGRPDYTLLTPDDKTKPLTALIDTNNDGKTDIMVMDLDRDGKWDISYHDVDYDGKIDLIGYHPDGDIKASRFEKYVDNKSARR
jgi:S1-C subfamily serine protease